MSHGHGTNIANANKIQIQNLREKVNNLESVVGVLLLALKDSNPELVLKYTKYVEKAECNKKF